MRMLCDTADHEIMFSGPKASLLHHGWALPGLTSVTKDALHFPLPLKCRGRQTVTDDIWHWTSEIDIQFQTSTLDTWDRLL